MKNTNSIKITRTVDTITVDFKYYDLQADTLCDGETTLDTTQSVNETDIKKWLESKYTDVKVLKITNVVTVSNLYEMDLSTFIEHATCVGEGRTKK